MSARQSDNVTDRLDDIVARLEALIGRPQVSDEYIRFRIDLLRAQWAVRQALSQGPQPVPQPSPATGTTPDRNRTEQPTPHPELGSVRFDPGLLQTVFSAICRSAEP